MRHVARISLSAILPNMEEHAWCHLFTGVVVIYKLLAKSIIEFVTILIELLRLLLVRLTT